MRATNDVKPVNEPYSRAVSAPPLTDEKLAEYTSLVSALPAGPVSDALTQLLTVVQDWWQLPYTERESAHGVPIQFSGGKRGHDQPLEEGHIARLADAIPWAHELNAMVDVFSPLTGPLRDCAFHLLWHAIELFHDREPLTQDRLYDGPDDGKAFRPLHTVSPAPSR